MTATEIVRLRLLEIAAVTALVSTRIHTLFPPQSVTQSYIRVQQISTNEVTHLRGGGPKKSRVQVDVVTLKRGGHDAYAEARNVHDALRGNGDGTALTGWSGTVGGVEVASILPGGEREQFDGPELGYVRIISDWIVQWKPLAV